MNMQDVYVPHAISPSPAPKQRPVSEFSPVTFRPPTGTTTNQDTFKGWLSERHFPIGVEVEGDRFYQMLPADPAIGRTTFYSL